MISSYFLNPKRRRRCSVLTFLAGLLTLSGCPQPGTVPEADLRPNIILILADDLGYADLSITGAPDIFTPNIDSIGFDGVRFTHSYVGAALCSPSRACIETGRFPATFGFINNPDPNLLPSDFGIPVEIETMGQTLQKAGYRTGFIGKWGVGHADQHHPNRNGYDEFYGFLGGPAGVGYYLDDPAQEGVPIGSQLLRNFEVTFTPEYLTDAFTREALEFIDRNQEQPFFLYLAHAAPHTPLEASDFLVSQFDYIEDPARRIYAAMIKSLDDGVGRILETLRDLGLDKNTLVIFTNDNGGVQQAYASNAPFRGGKSSFLEGGIRVPLLMRFSGVIPSGLQFHHPVFLGDIFATACGLAETTSPPMDGIDLMPHLIGPPIAPPHDTLFWAGLNASVIRKGVWKLTNNPRFGFMTLYNVDQDPGETTNRINEFVVIREQLLADLTEWRASVPPPLFLGFLKNEF